MKLFSILSGSAVLLLYLGTCAAPPDGTVPSGDRKPPVISGFSPAAQETGLSISIFGSNFDTSPANNDVYVNGTSATSIYALNDTLTVLVPSEATSGFITVTTSAGTAESSTRLWVLGGTAPLISSFSPESGTAGTNVTIFGEIFDFVAENNVVLFNGSVATVTAATDTSLTVTVPDAVSGNITVTTFGGTATSSKAFLVGGSDSGTMPFIESFTPLRGEVGDNVTITGANFDTIVENNTVKINDIEATIASASETSIIVIVPDTTSGTITVNVSGHVAKSESSFEVIPAGGYGTVPGLLGGSVQSSDLTLLGAVSIFAGGGIAGGAVDGTGTDARFDNPIGIASDGTNLYIADANNRMIRQLVLSTAEVTTLAGSGDLGSTDGIGVNADFKTPNGIVEVNGNLYVTDSSDNKIRKIVISTGEVATFAGSGSFGSADGTGTAASFKSPTGITSDGTNLYIADSGGNTIREIEIATGVVTTLAGSGAFGSADGSAAEGSFFTPSGVVTDGVNVYVADTGNHKIRKVTIATGEITTLAGTGDTDSADGTGTAAGFHSPDRIASDGTYLYVSDSGNHKIRQIEIFSAEVTTLAGSGIPGNVDQTGVSASFTNPRGIVFDGLNLYVADSGAIIRQIVISTGAVTTIAGDASDQNSINGIGTAAKFNKPEGITTDGTNLYVADSNHRLIRKIVIATAKVYTLAGSGFFGSSDATATSASFNYPFGITTDGVSLFVTDTHNNKIRKIVLSSGVVTTFAGSGGVGDTDDTGPFASFWHPTGITTDGIHLYVTDTLNHKIRKIEISTGIVSTLAGSGEEGSTDEAGTEASFSNPKGITTDGTNLYVTDSGNHKIRQIVLSSGVVTTLAGSGDDWTADGLGTSASFRSPYGITTDGTSLYVTDSSARTIRQVVISTGLVTTLAGSGDEGTADGTGSAATFMRPVGITSDGTSLFVVDYLSHQIRKID